MPNRPGQRPVEALEPILRLSRRIDKLEQAPYKVELTFVNKYDAGATIEYNWRLRVIDRNGHYPAVRCAALVWVGQERFGTFDATGAANRSVRPNAGAGDTIEGLDCWAVVVTDESGSAGFTTVEADGADENMWVNAALLSPLAQEFVVTKGA